MSFSLPRIFKWIYDPVKKCKTNVLLLKIGFLQNSVGNLFAPVSYGLVGPVKPKTLCWKDPFYRHLHLLVWGGYD